MKRVFNTSDQAELKKFATQHSWISQMNNSKGLDGHHNYSGGMDKPDWIVVVGRNRDSEILDESNFETALEMLGGESKNVSIERFGHWGCSWFELLLVNPKSKKYTKIAYEIHAALDRYPVLDDSDFSDREHEYQLSYANGAKEQLAKALCETFGLPEEFETNKYLLDVAIELNMWVQMYAGNDACLDLYPGREIDEKTAERIQKCLSDSSYNFECNPAYQYLCACFGMGDA